MSLHSTFLATWLLGLALWIAPRAVFGQVPAADSTRAVSDSQPALTDSAQTAGAAQAPDSAPGADSTRAVSDTASPRSSRSTAPADTVTATAPMTPPDSILSAACGGSAGSATVARDLLVIVFTPETVHAQRAAAAKSVDGTLLGPVMPVEPGAYYLRVPSGGEEYRLRAAADQLIQLASVQQVGSRACPPGSPP